MEVPFGASADDTAPEARPIPAQTTMGASEPHAAVGKVMRLPDASSVMSLLPLIVLLPISILCASLFAGILGAITKVNFSWYLLIFYVLGFTLFIRPVQEIVAGVMFKARKPTPEEQRILAGPWRSLLEGAGLKESAYILRTEDSDHVNALAAGGHVVCVTTGALHALSGDELLGVLSHELGHHLGFHSAVSTLANWLLLPVNAVLYLFNLTASLGEFLARIFQAFGNGPVAMVTSIMSLFLRLYMLMISGVVKFVMLFLTAFGRRAELTADAASVDLGLGPQLRSALLRFQLEEGPSSRSVRELLTSSHPTTAKRIARIDSRMARQRASG